MFAEAEIGALWCLHVLELGDVDVVLTRKPRCRRRRSTVGAERRGDRRAGHQLFEIGLPLGDLRDAGGQPPGRAVAFNRRIRDQPVRSQRAVEAVPNLPGQDRQPRCGQLFSSEFQQKFAIHV